MYCALLVTGIAVAGAAPGWGWRDACWLSNGTDGTGMTELTPEEVE